MKLLRKIVLLILPLLLVDAFLVEPYWLREKHWQMPMDNLQHPIRILHISDLQLRGNSGYRERWVLSRVSEEHPDFVAMTGDLYENPEGMKAGEEFLKQLQKFVPVFVILGNWEHWAHVDVHGYGVRLQKEHIQFLRNTCTTAVFNQQQLTIAGVDDPSTFRSDLDAALANVKKGIPILLLSHAPFIFDSAAAHVQGVLAGHTHGGQIDIPLYGPVWMPYGCRPYIYGAYHSRSAWMVVTSGVGTSQIPARFYCRPEISWVALVPK